MSSPQVDWSLGSAEGLPLSDSECLLLLDADIDIIDYDGDLLRHFPCATLVGSAAERAGYAEGGDEGAALLYPPSPLDCKPSRAQLASDLLQQLDTQCKQETFPTWLEEKVELPIFEPVAPVRDLPAPLPPPLAPPAPILSLTPPAPLAPALSRPDDTAALLREFDKVYGEVEIHHLTPPQSPPGPATQLLLSYAHAHNAPPSPYPLHLDSEMALVDEVVRHTSAHLASPSSSYSSPSPSSASSTDEDWDRPTRAKPYARPTEERRSRKKEQNKNAATRYRQKKKAEVEVLLGEETALRQRQNELGSKCSDLQREIRYLKGLMRDLFKAKGLIK